MTTQSELQLELQLIQQLHAQGFAQVTLKDENALLANLKQQIERANHLPELSANEWKQVLSFLNNGSVFERAKNLRNLCPLKFDNGESKHITLLFKDPSRNLFQVSNQISLINPTGNARSYRFDVTLLVNGLPLVQIELKKRGMEIAEAFHQVQRYSREAYAIGQGLFNFIQLFVISNGVNTRYYANGTNNIAFAFPWADFNNQPINDLTDFAQQFLNPTHLTKMLCDYMVLLHTTQQLMVLRPYQIYAVEQIVQQVQNTNDNGYIWHTTGSGKTLTSFKASQIMMQLPQVEKVLFVVDRNDLDTQTAREFNEFKQDSVDSSKNTHKLVQQLQHNHDKLIVTTIQKLNRAICTENHSAKIDYLRDKKVVFIFDECHRSQFGETHRNIKKFFHNAQMFGFTGTPIFAENGLSQAGLKLTTDFLFGQRLHQYVIVDAIRDRNVLQFQIDYRGKYSDKSKNSTNDSSINQATALTDDFDVTADANLDHTALEEVRAIEEVEGIDTQELFENPARLEKIARYILSIHDTKTKNREFTAMFCVSSVDVLTQYYSLFEQLQYELQQVDPLYQPLKVATIFSYAANEQVDAQAAEDQSGLIFEESTDAPSQINRSNRDKLDHCIAQYNSMFGTSYNSGEQFYDYYRDIALRVKAREIDILLVVNMFLTGFDSKPLNTLYVDKNLKYHGLIQAFSRTNRVYTDNKPFGNIICFRNLKRATDEALQLFSNKQAPKVVLVPSYNQILADYNCAVKKLTELTPTCQDVDALQTEDEQLAFIKAFREVMRFNAQLQTFVAYNQDQTTLSKQAFNDYASKYKDLCHAVKNTSKREKVSVLNDVDFQLDLLHSDRVNVGYILNLLQMALNTASEQKREQYTAQVHDLIASEVSLYDKQELIQKFIDENLPKMINGQSVQEAFSAFWDAEKEQAYQQMCAQDQLKTEEFKKILDNYEFTKRMPSLEDVTHLPAQPLKLFERKTVLSNLVLKTQQFIEKFYTGL